MKIAILIDSSCGIKNTKDYKDLYLVPLMITKEDGQQIADDANLKDDEFYKLNDSQLLKTSQSVPGDVMGKWDELLKEYDEVVCLLLSKGLSGQYNTFRMFSQEDEYINKIHVIDTNGVSIVIKRQLELVQKLISEGKTGKEVKEIIEKFYNQINGYIIPKSLDQLVRGGRISKAAAGLAKILKITPILKYNGEIDKQGKTRTFKKAVEEAIELLKHTYPNNKKIDISYSRADDETLELVKNIIENSGLEIGLFDNLANTIICHTGRETFAFMPFEVWGEELWK
ncbi:DegV family protein [Spiroplasma diminutum]|uniref:DegV family protein n=1 Tax=Spiroplasma diminutum CUAS-1 TaxID=1276221 RepID=S5M0Q9_9MOLU|nr:DegV family protein [Spiroplasma diminutum]AGR42431.1 DegV family protein [Spiroplasma diminutum CUAS-1]